MTAHDPMTISPELVQTVCHLVLVLAGLPLLIRAIVRIVEQRSLAPVDTPWPDVCWGRDAGGFEFVIVAVVLHMLLNTGLAWLIDGPLDLKSWSDGALAGIVQTLLMCGQWVVTCGLLLCWIRWYARGRLETVGLTTARLGQSVRVGAETFLAIMPAVLVVLYIALMLHAVIVPDKPPGDHPVLAAARESGDPWIIAGFFVLAGLVVPFFEELFYRGLIQTTLLRSGNAVVAIVGTSLLFGLAHLGMANGPIGAPAVTVLSLGLGYAYYRTRSLWAPVTLHALFNLYNLSLTVGTEPMAKFLDNFS